METWEMTQAEFIGPLPKGGFNSPSVQNWVQTSAAVLPQMTPDWTKFIELTGINSHYALVPVVGSPGEFIAYEMTLGSAVPVGLYDATVIIIDPNHTKRWIGEELVLAASAVRQLSPNTPRQLTTVSHKLFKRAHELAVRRAHAALHDIRMENLAEYGIPRRI